MQYVNLTLTCETVTGYLYPRTSLRVICSWILTREPEVVFFLSSRPYTVCKSKWKSIIRGIPEVWNPARHCIGPGPVLIVINDLPSVVENESSIFADDTTMLTFGEDLAYSCRSLTLDLNAASHWAKVWGMLYNAEKSQHLTRSKRSKHVRVSSLSILGWCDSTTR